jgi:hypothetical protein
MSETKYPQNWLIGQDFDPNQHLLAIERFDKRLNQKVVTDYLNVQNRLIWFIRDQRALIAAGLASTTYVVQTDLIELDRQQGWAHFKSYVRDVLGNEATMYGSESVKDFSDYIEKASTKSLGRALLLLGYGTAFADELDEGSRVVDAPMATNQYAAVPSTAAIVQEERPVAHTTRAATPPAAARRQVPAQQQHSATNDKLLKIAAWCTEHGISGIALNQYRERHQLSAKVDRHVERLWNELESNDADVVGELSCIELAIKHLTNITVISEIMRQQQIANFAAFWREYQANPDDWNAFIDEWLGERARAAAKA